MTDNEIIKALEQCSLPTGCKECPCFPNGPCITHKDVLSLINRQKAEIERLEAEIDNQYEQAKADILGNMADGGTSCHWCIEQHRAEAIKYFAERLKAKFIPSLSFNEDLQKVVTVKDIDNLVKEMVGDGND